MRAPEAKVKKLVAPIWALLCVVAYLILLYVGLVTSSNLIGLINPNLLAPLGRYSTCVSEFILLSLGVVVMVIFLRKRFGDFVDSIGLMNKRAPYEVAAGFSAGAFVLGIMFGVMALVGGYSVSKFNFPIDVFPALMLYFIAGFTEELIFRGFIFRLLEKSGGTVYAIVFSSLAFGFAHILNMPPNAEPAYVFYACLLLSFEAGLPLSGAFLLTRSVWLATGFHWAWNLLEGTIFGVSVSGTDPGPSFLTSRLQGNQFVSGGIFGPEASLPFFFVGAAFGLLFLYLAYKRGSWSFAIAAKDTAQASQTDPSV